MKTCKKCLQTKEKNLFYKRLASNDGLTSTCKSCVNQNNKEWLSNNPDKRLKISQKWRMNNFDKQRQSEINYRANNADKRKESISKYQKSNRNLINFWAASRRFSKKIATPSWANFDKIKEFYDTADKLSMITGEWYEVDHQYPLKSEWVCGLHCENNLQIITRSENRSKGNRLWV